MRAKSFLGLLCLVVVVLSCRKDAPEADSLDQELSGLLESTSNGQGMAWYQLPESNQYDLIPQDPKNPITTQKVELGKMLFHETNLAIFAKSDDGMYTYSCATCHHAPGGFQACMEQGLSDGGMGFGLHGEGRILNGGYSLDSIDVQPLRTPSVLNSAYQQVQLWNGQFGATGLNTGTEANWTVGSPKENNHLGYEGVETQAIAGLTVHRMGLDPDFIMNSEYKEMFDNAFPGAPSGERYTLINAGLAIAAYERTVLANKSPFQEWLKGDHEAMSEDEKQGAILFFGKAECAGCHNGPALNSMAFHSLGMRDLDAPGTYGGGPSENDKKGRGGFNGNPEDDYKFKVPQLYSIRYSPFYGHGASFKSIYDIVAYKNKAIKENSEVPEDKLDPHFKPLGLTDNEVALIATFLEYGLDDPKLHRYEPLYLPSGNCFPNNDLMSKADLGCN